MTQCTDNKCCTGSATVCSALWSYGSLLNADVLRTLGNAFPRLVSASTWCLPYLMSTIFPLKSEGKLIFLGSCTSHVRLAGLCLAEKWTWEQASVRLRRIDLLGAKPETSNFIFTPRHQAPILQASFNSRKHLRQIPGGFPETMGQYNRRSCCTSSKVPQIPVILHLRTRATPFVT